MSNYVIETPENAPANTTGAFTIFLAGSIEMGKASAWQSRVASMIADRWSRPERVVFWNPRRAHGFNPSTIDAQIRWEQERLHRADAILMVLEADTTSPVSMLEFGEFIGSGKLFTVCPDGFYRKRNLELTAKYYVKRIYKNIDDGVNALIRFS